MELKGFKLKFKAEGKVLEKGERDEAKRDDNRPRDASHHPTRENSRPWL
jgi:hypothetical protein